MSTNSTPCTYAGCTGTVEDGYCDLCGMAPPAGAAAAPVPGRSGARPAGGPAASPGTGGVPSGGISSGGALPGSARPGSAQSGSVQSRGILSGGWSSRSSGRTTPTNRSTRTGSTSSSRRGMLGAGLVEVPAVPYRDPASAVLDRPEVAEHKRFCSSCGEAVGRGRGDRPGRTEGFCANCGSGFSFTPKLSPGDLVGGQYEVLGCLAHGGLGWIYLARDRNVSDRWVVLKGLLDTGDAEALAAAAAERSFLAEVEHPNIVKIYNFVQHPEPRTGVLVGYIVMEYVGGQSLKDILLERREQFGPDASLPLGQVIAYALEVLRALGYLHGLGLIYCDFKPDNAIQAEEQLKLLDLGGVRRATDVDSPIYGTVGYQAPEIATLGPSISSDLYTVGRTLAVLSFPFRGYTGIHATSLPDRANVPLLSRYESYDRFLRRATHPEPAERFQSAAEMAEQLTGVLREVLSAEDGSPRPAPSTLFGPERYTAGAEITALEHGVGPALGSLTPATATTALPVPLVYGSDPAAGFLAGLTIREPDALATALVSAPVASPEVGFMLARVKIELGGYREAEAQLDEIEAQVAGDWRLDWYRGLAALAGGRFDLAQRLFDGLYTWLPGEAAPKLALAFTLELAGPRNAPDRNAPDPGAPARLYEAVWRTDHGHVSAAFGLARVRLAAGDRAGAVAALDAVPEISSQYVAAQVAAVAAAVRGRDPGELTEQELLATGRRLAGLRLEGTRGEELTAEVVEAALGWVLAGRVPSGGTPLLGAPLTEHALRRRLERSYRELARLAQGSEHRHTLVIRANTIRPRTLF
ncbi:tetratricopeptide repeat protein [Actinomadura scrupuli]|uniref:serine/threonine-protein kinase n=1 Tax=Actinomadura scrupuli TaxID=559629 RepID=UPI003D98A532